MNLFTRKSSAPGRGNKPVQAKRSFVTLLLGETGSGKSTVINYLTNYFKGGTLAEPRVAIPNRFFEATEGSPNSEQHIDDQTISKTAKCTLYAFTLEDQHFQFIDSPGLSDTRGVAHDDENIALILEAAEHAGTLSAVVLVINGTVARATVNLKNTLSKLRGNLPDLLIDNLIVVLTNCSRLSYNFDFRSLYPWKIKPRNIFVMNNSAFSRNPVDWKNDASDAFGNMQEAWNKSMDEIQKMVYRISDLDERSTGVFKDLRNNREKLKEEMHEILLEIKKLQQIQDEIEKAKILHQAALHDVHKYRNFKQAQIVVYTVLVDAEYYSTICMVHVDGVCHQQCRLPETTQPNTGVHIRCSCMGRGPTCAVCGCGHQTHYHARKKLEKRAKTVESVLQDVKWQYDNSSARVHDWHNKMSKLEDDLHLLGNTLKIKQTNIDTCCQEMRRICSAFNFADERNSVLQALETNARTLTSLVARQEADKIIRSIKDLTERLQPNSVNTRYEQDGYYNDIDFEISRQQTRGAASSAGPQIGSSSGFGGQAGRSKNQQQASTAGEPPPPYSKHEGSASRTSYADVPRRPGAPPFTMFPPRPQASNRTSNRTALDSNSPFNARPKTAHNDRPTHSNTPCRYYNRMNGCSNPSCGFSHKCSACGMLNHGFTNCSRQQSGIFSNTGPGGSAKNIKGTCYEFNRGHKCKNDPCPFKHLCGLCGQLHSALEHGQSNRR